LRLTVVKAEFIVADADDAAIDQPRVIDPLPVEIGAIAAPGIAQQPAVVVVKNDGMDARGKWIGHDDLAVQATTDAIFGMGVEKVVSTGSKTPLHAQVSCHGADYANFTATNNGGRVSALSRLQWVPALTDATPN
jgi:hypothetical protein